MADELSIISKYVLRLRKLRIILRRPLLRRAFFRYLVMAGVEHQAVLREKLSMVVDIGANRGQFALAARGISGARVVSFEPIPEVAGIYEKVMAGDDGARLFRAAIGETSGRVPIHLSARDDSSSLLEIGEAQSAHFPGTQEVGILEVEVAPLDSFLSADDIVAPAMLKLDVQGFELPALKGSASLFHCFDQIYCECSFVELYKGQKLAADVVEYLAAQGFHLSGLFNPAYDGNGNCIQADFHFKRSL